MTTASLGRLGISSLLALSLILVSCAGGEQPAGPEAAAGAGDGAGGREGGPPADAATPPGPEAAPPGRGTARPPAAPRYFAHARFVPLRDNEGRPLGLQVEMVLPGGRVALAGVQVGDLLHAIDYIPLDDPATFDRAVRMAEDVFLDRRPQHMVVTRQGRKFGLMPLGPLQPEAPPSPSP